jgi:hypothetical protein
MSILDNLDNPLYPESWDIQTPKGYDPHIEIARLQNKESVIINDGLALKVFNEEVCDHCSCKPAVSDNLLESQTSFEE